MKIHYSLYVASKECWGGGVGGWGVGGVGGGAACSSYDLVTPREVLSTIIK